MDGSSDITTVSSSADGGVRLGATVHRHLLKEVPANVIAALQTAVLAAVLALALLAESGVGTVSATYYVHGVLIVCGFAIAAIYWAATWRGGGFWKACEEVGRRGLHVAALVFFAGIASTLVGGGDVVDPTRTFVALVAIAAAGVGVMAIVDRLGRRSAARCIMVFGDAKTASDLAQQVRRELPRARVCVWPETSLPSATVEAEQDMRGWPPPTIVELAPDVALISSVTSDAAMAKLMPLLAPLSIDVLVDAPRRSGRLPGAIITFAGFDWLRVFPRPLSPFQRAMKRGFDIAASFTLIVLLLPLLSVIALVIRIDSRGPALFLQPRVGQHGLPFTIWKFRTMVTEAADLHAKNPTVVNDPRVTRIGAVLRRTSLDELPQLFNVLLGSMSIVGPRPHAMNGNHFDAIMENYAARHRVKPGITGLAQVSGWRGPTDTATKIEQRTANDLRYIREWSLRQDVLILCRTVFALTGKNAF